MRDLVGAALAIFLSLLALLYAAPQIQRNSRQLLDAPNAYQVQSFAQAANAYLSVPATFTAVLAATGAGNVQISAATLKAAGALDPSFVDSNGYGQSHVVIVHQVNSTQLQALVMTCGGTAIADQSVRHLIELGGGPIQGGGIRGEGVLSSHHNGATARAGHFLRDSVTAGAGPYRRPAVSRRQPDDPALSVHQSGSGCRGGS